MPVEESGYSCRFEIEFTGVLLGFLFVMDSIILTMPDDVLSIVKSVGVSGYLGIPQLSFGDLFSLASFYAMVLLLAAILFYFSFEGFKRSILLIFARSFLAISLYLIVILVVVVNGAFMARLVGTQSMSYMNPIAGEVLSVSLMILLIYLAAYWIAWVPSLRGRFLKVSSRMKGKLRKIKTALLRHI